MISFNLRCGNGHLFQGWFASSDTYQTQVEAGLVSCTQCGSTKIDKALMAPKVRTARKQQAAHSLMAKDVAKNLARLREAAVSGAEDVGSKFPEEARRIHYGEREAKSIYGRASPAEASDLIEEGIAILPLPPKPEEAN